MGARAPINRIIHVSWISPEINPERVVVPIIRFITVTTAGITTFPWCLPKTADLTDSWLLLETLRILV